MTTDTLDLAVDTFRKIFQAAADDQAGLVPPPWSDRYKQVMTEAALFVVTTETLQRFRKSISRTDYLSLEVMARKVIEQRIAELEHSGTKRRRR